MAPNSPGELFVSQAGVQTLEVFYRNLQTQFIDMVTTQRPQVETKLETALRGKAAGSYLLMVDDFVRDFTRFVDAEVEQLRMTLTMTASKITAVDEELGAIIQGMQK